MANRPGVFYAEWFGNIIHCLYLYFCVVTDAFFMCLFAFIELGHTEYE